MKERDCIVQIQCDSYFVAEEVMYLAKHFDLYISVLPADTNIDLQVCVKVPEEEKE